MTDLDALLRTGKTSSEIAGYHQDEWGRRFNVATDPFVYKERRQNEIEYSLGMPTTNTFLSPEERTTSTVWPARLDLYVNPIVMKEIKKLDQEHPEEQDYESHNIAEELVQGDGTPAGSLKEAPMMVDNGFILDFRSCLLYTSPSPRD